MNNDMLNRWLTLCANIGVLIGIILLLVELNQTQEIARAEIRNQIYLGLTENLALIDSETADAIARLKAGEEIGTTDVILVDRWAEGIYRYWENADYQFQMGLYDESEYAAQRISIQQVILNFYPEVLITHYCLIGEGLSDHFKTFLDTFLTRDMCDHLTRYSL